MKKIVFLASGGGGTAKFLFQAIQCLNLPWEISGIITDRDCPAYAFSVGKNIFACKIIYKKDHPGELWGILDSLAPDMIITNIHKIIDSATLNHYPGIFMNLHYSLLPAFGGVIGMKTLELAKTRGVRFIGSTCHWVTEDIDNGPVLAQCCHLPLWDVISDDRRVETTFRGGCLALLAGLTQHFDGQSLETSTIQMADNQRLWVSPGLPSVTPFSQEEFWDSVKSI